MLIPETELVTVASAGTPIQISLTKKCCALRVKNPGNASDRIYVGIAGLTKATGAFVIDDLDVGQPFELGRQTVTENTIDPRHYWIDAEDNGQVALVTTWRNV